MSFNGYYKGGIVGPGHRQRVESSPHFRELAAMRSVFREQQKPPYTAVRALFRSRGYIVGWSGCKEKWNVSQRGAWVPFKLTVVGREEEGATVTRWLRWVGGEKPQVSDGRDIPRDRVFAYAAACHRGKMLSR